MTPELKTHHGSMLFFFNYVRQKMAKIVIFITLTIKIVFQKLIINMVLL
jgi:hypothetical protein